MALPISGEFLMSYAGYFVYQGKMNYILALLTVFASGGAGITVTYWIGKAGGFKLIEKFGKYIHLGPERYNIAEYLVKSVGYMNWTKGFVVVFQSPIALDSILAITMIRIWSKKRNRGWICIWRCLDIL
ncbi:hypothetical protein V7161_03995 [Neobacillus drentensis]